ncbi:heterochromatin protein 1-binding protein 3 isoform X3 [Oncorhynchus mykiss]|uniref:heterochromatin protein 1-binding protein 3 isoform X3 n=1 Tax=Oncorhynchus mykiss TaxID=8022 RepID=UPI001877DF37|nr:heterochromatin protein 1-binding protein 3 isoform X3 [Oncorhynchus mykiss]
MLPRTWISEAFGVMPIRRAARTPPQEMPPSAAPEGEPDASSEESASVEEEQEMASAALVAKEGEGTGEGETKENGEKPEGEKGDESTGEKTAEGEESEKKEEKDGVKEKVKKPVKRAIPAWATMSASKRATLTNKSTSTMQLPKMDDILIEAIESCKEKTGASAHSVMKYIVKKYPNLEKRKFLLKKALKRQLEKGTVKQLKGKGLSGSFTIGKQSSNKPTAKGKPIVVAPGLKAETLGDALPLIITRLCEPKEASYILIKKYVEQHFPQLNVEHRPDILKSALVRAVDKGHLEQITGKGASGTFQLKREGGKFLLKGGPLEDAIMTSIVAMNEPKTCSTTTLRKFLLETNQDSMEYRVVNNLKRTLQKCKMMGWMDQITGNGLNGTYQLCYPYYPSPAILFPEKQNVKEQKVAEKDKRRKRVDLSDEDSDEEEEDSSEEEDSDDEPPPKRKAGKRPPPKARRPPPSKKSRPASQSRAKGKKRAAPAKRSAPPAKRSAPPAKRSAPPAKRSAPPAKRSAPPPVKVSPPVKAPPPVKKAAPASKPKTPIIKKLMSKASKRPTPKKSPPAKKAAANSAVKAKPAARKSLRGKK